MRGKFDFDWDEGSVAMAHRMECSVCMKPMDFVAPGYYVCSSCGLSNEDLHEGV
jgi:hypothetical protein